MMPFTTIYKFMWKDLGLHGAEKEFFAVIYGFWRRSKAPVEIPIRTVTEITGLSRTSVILAKRGLLKKELVAAQEIRGKPTRYEVLIPDPLEIRTGADSERGLVQKSNGYPSGNYTGADAAPKINTIRSKTDMKREIEINQILSASVNNSKMTINNDMVPKLPNSIAGISKEKLEETLTQLYRKAVEARGIEFGEPVWPEPIKEYNEVLEFENLVFKGHFQIKIPVTAVADGYDSLTTNATFHYQACDNSICLSTTRLSRPRRKCCWTQARIGGIKNES